MGSAGRSVVLTEETDWIGGQLTSQAVPPDEHPWIEQFGATASYRRLRDGIRDHYRRWYPLRTEARDRPDLNPGAGRVSRLCHEPRVALAVLEAMLAPYRAAGTPTVLLHTVPVTADVDGDRVTAVTLRSTTGRARTTPSRDPPTTTSGGPTGPTPGPGRCSVSPRRSRARCDR